MKKKRLSLYLGKFSGIEVYIHWTFLILIGWIFLLHAEMGHDWMAGLWGVAFILALFACVVLHEFSHALTAQRYGIRTRDITIYPIGGIASLESMPEKPGQELVVALAGPAMNVVIAAILWIYLRATGTMPELGAWKNAKHLQDLPFAFNLMAANIALAVFNLIPAFPMDGGRVLRAALSFKISRIEATRVAALIGQILAVIFVFFGFFYNFWLVFIGLFIYLGAGTEAAFETTKNVLAGFKVRDVLMRRFTPLSPGDNIEKAVQILLDGQEHDFLVTINEEVKGVLTRKELIHGLSSFGQSAPISGIMRTDFTILTPDMNLQEVYMKMLANDATVCPVLENGRLLGMVDKDNISELILVQQAIHSND
ncbi:site-2 protease family protein [Chitinophaga sp. HK235]|uniref:site-2 protease family protein n=1 Tax=Chitinophaga sp. HK235 TaxID=2952571 RepID=UPI001BA7E1F0|nr:site-2 protease family protein [Chitinophaga sp. HK235]